MENQHDLTAFAEALAEAARKVRTAKAVRVDEVNAIFEQLGEDLLRAATALGHPEKRSNA